MSPAVASQDTLPLTRPGACEFLPNLFILGVAKCGTTTLHAHLAELPDVCMSSPKEPFYFEAEYERGVDFYRDKYFAHFRGQSVVGKARHRNLYLPYIPPRIHALNPDARLIVLARNPIERAFSHWYHNWSRGLDELGFAAALRADLARIERGLRYDSPEERAELMRHFRQNGDAGDGPYRTYLDSAYYFEQIARYLALFPAENLRVILFDDLVSRPADVVREVAQFVGLPTPPAKTVAERHENPKHKPAPPGWMGTFYHRSGLRAILPPAARRWAYDFVHEKIYRLWEPRIGLRTRFWLRHHYRLHIRQLAEFLNRDLSHWK